MTPTHNSQNGQTVHGRSSSFNSLPQSRIPRRSMRCRKTLPPPPMTTTAVAMTTTVVHYPPEQPDIAASPLREPNTRATATTPTESDRLIPPTSTTTPATTTATATHPPLRLLHNLLHLLRPPQSRRQRRQRHPHGILGAAPPLSRHYRRSTAVGLLLMVAVWLIVWLPLLATSSGVEAARSAGVGGGSAERTFRGAPLYETSDSGRFEQLEQQHLQQQQHQHQHRTKHERKAAATIRQLHQQHQHQQHHSRHHQRPYVCPSCKQRKNFESLSLDSFKKNILNRLNINMYTTLDGAAAIIQSTAARFAYLHNAHGSPLRNVSTVQPSTAPVAGAPTRSRRHLPVVADSVLRKFYKQGGLNYIRLKRTPEARRRAKAEARAAAALAAAAAAADAAMEGMQSDQPVASSAEGERRVDDGYVDDETDSAEAATAAEAVVAEDDGDVNVNDDVDDDDVDDDDVDVYGRDAFTIGSDYNVNDYEEDGEIYHEHPETDAEFVNHFQHRHRHSHRGRHQQFYPNRDDGMEAFRLGNNGYSRAATAPRPTRAELMRERERLEDEELYEEEFYSSTNSLYASPKVTHPSELGALLDFGVVLADNLEVIEARLHLHVASAAPAASSATTTTSSPPPADQRSHPVRHQRHHDQQRRQQQQHHQHHHHHRHGDDGSSSGVETTAHTTANPLHITVSSAVPARNYTRLEAEYSGSVPAHGRGRTVSLNVTDVVREWMRKQRVGRKPSPQKRHTETHEEEGEQEEEAQQQQNPGRQQQLIVKTDQTWMRETLSLELDTENSPYLELRTRVAPHARRRKRDVRGYDCRTHGKEKYCCRYPLRVDFRAFGWDWVIAPDVYEAYYCSGECLINHVPATNHAVVAAMSPLPTAVPSPAVPPSASASTTVSASVQPCCSPRRMSSLRLLYVDEMGQVILTEIPNMAVEQCACS